MEEELSLPPLSALLCDEQKPVLGGSRKRGRLENALAVFSNSSDPAIFSSDDDPALDNYTKSRRKKRYVGAWFEKHPSSSDSTFEGRQPPALSTKPSQRTLQRHLDSGVWLSSDETDVECDAIESPALAHSTTQLRGQPRVFQRVPSLCISTAECRAREVIGKCLDNSDEIVDLSGLLLDDLSNATIEPLSEFVCVPLVVSQDVAFEQKSPSLKLYLGTNSLTRLPGAIFDLEFITVLSVRRNGLREIPPAIGKLINLEELNLSLNELHFLPFELLELINSSAKLRTLSWNPNPWYRPWQESESNVERAFQSNIGPEVRRLARQEQIPNPEAQHPAHFTMRSPVEYLDSRARTYSNFKLQERKGGSLEVLILHALDADWMNNTHPTLDPAYSKHQHAAVLPAPSAVPTLMELALGACYKSTGAADAPRMLSETRAAPYLVELVERALHQKDVGGWVCSVCKRPSIIKKTSWLEWWQLDQDHSPGMQLTAARLVPFVSHGCSWRCVPTQPTLVETCGATAPA